MPRVNIPGGGGASAVIDPLEPVDRLQHLVFRGRKMDRDLADRVLTATVSGSIDQVTEVAVTFADPDFRVLRSGMFSLKTPVTYRGMRLHVAVVETEDVGDGQVVVRMRPRKVWALRQARGKKVMRNVSPTKFVEAECRAVGMDVVAQSSGKRKTVTRDVPERGETYDVSTYPSSWTTFQRLADELGFICFEWAGTLYFGKPTWLVRKAHQGAVKATWQSDSGSDVFGIPVFRHSLDAEDVEFECALGLGRADDVWPGRGITFPDLPGFGGTYMVRSVEYPLAGPGTVTVTGGTATNPEPAGQGSSGTSVTDDPLPGLDPIRPYSEALAYAEREEANPSQNWAHRCQTFARMCVGAAAFGTSAIAAWNSIDAQYKGHSTPPPAGSIAYYNLSDSGHAVFVADDGWVFSTNSNTGNVDKVRWSAFGSYLGYITHCPSGDLPVQRG